MFNKKMFALGRLKSGEMNKTEAAYEKELNIQLKAGEILWYKFEAIKLRLADKTFYNVDFFVMNKNCELEAREIKGFMMEDANVKIKVAASMYPFRFYIIRVKAKKDGGGWDIKEVSGN